MIQTEKYGTPLASALRVLSAEFRHQRMMRAEEKAARLPAIMTVPLILFILPTLFVVILGPASLLDQRQLPPRLSQARVHRWERGGALKRSRRELHHSLGTRNDHYDRSERLDDLRPDLPARPADRRVPDRRRPPQMEDALRTAKSSAAASSRRRMRSARSTGPIRKRTGASAIRLRAAAVRSGRDPADDRPL